MSALARSRRLTRCVAVWVLLWFAALQATALLAPPPASPAVGHHQHAAEDCDEGHAEHGGTEHTAAHHLVQCPGCLFSTAPPPQDFDLPTAVVAAPAAPAPPRATAARAETPAQPPARGPPRFS